MSGWFFNKKGSNLTGVGTFKTIQTPSGTSPVATGLTDVLTLTAGSGITITGDSTTDTVTIAASGGGSGTPGGADTNVQFNNAGSFDGDSNFIWDDTNKALGVAITGSPLGKVHAKGTTPPDRPASVTVTLGSYGAGFAYNLPGTFDYRVYTRDGGIFSNNYRNNTLAVANTNWQPLSIYAAINNIGLGFYDETSYPAIYQLYAVYTGFVGQPLPVAFAPDVSSIGLNGAYNGPQGSPGYEALGQTMDFRVVTVYGTQYTASPASFQYIDGLVDNSYFNLDFTWSNPSATTPDEIYIQRDTGGGFVDYIDVTGLTNFTDDNTAWINGDPLSAYASPINFDVEIFFNPPPLVTDFVEFLIVDEIRSEYITALDTDLSKVDNGSGWTAGAPTLDPFVTWEVDVSWAAVTGADDYRVVAANTGDGKNYNYFRDVTAPTVSFTDDDIGWTGPVTVTLTPNSGYAFYAESSDAYYGGRAIFERNTTAPTNTDVDMFFILNNTNASGVSKIGFSTSNTMKTVISANQLGNLLFKTQHNNSSYIGFNAGLTGFSDSTPTLSMNTAGVGIFYSTPTSAMPAALAVFNNSGSKVGFVLRGATSQSANLITIQNVSTTTIAYIASDGTLVINNHQGATSSSLFKGALSQNLLNIGHNSNAIGICDTPESGVQLKITSINAANKLLVLKGTTSQTGNLIDARDDSDNIVFSLFSDGRVQAADGNATIPGYSFISNSGTGFFTGGLAVIGAAINGTEYIRLTTTGLGIARSSASARLHIAAGNTNPSTAPIKIESGSLMTTPEAGAIERLTDKLHFTISTGTARKEFTLNDTALTSGRVPFVTTNGRLTDDADLTFATDRLTATKMTTTLDTHTSSAAPGSPAEGDLWNDSTQKALIGFIDGAKQALVGTIFTQTATATVANTVTETALTSTGVGTLTLPANFLTVGKCIRIRGLGVHSASGNPTITIRVKLGSTTIATMTGASGSGTNEGIEIDAVTTLRTTGASGTQITQGEYVEEQSAGLVAGANNTAAGTIDTTTSQTISVTAQWGTASASNSISLTNLTVEVLN